jgi:hypothetical protein
VFTDYVQYHVLEVCKYLLRRGHYTEATERSATTAGDDGARRTPPIVLIAQQVVEDVEGGGGVPIHETYLCPQFGHKILSVTTDRQTGYSV